MLTNGFIKLKRNIVNWRWFHNHKTFKMYIFLLCHANICDVPFENIIIKKGQCLTSLDSLSKQTNLSIQEVRTTLKNLKSTNDITVESTSKYTLITVNDDMALNLNTNSKTSINQTINNQSAINYQQYNNNKNNNNKNNKNENTSNHSDTQIVVDMFCNICPYLDVPTPNQKDKINIDLLLKKYSLDEIKQCFMSIANSDFLMGKVTEFKATFSFVINPNNFESIKNGKYQNFVLTPTTQNNYNIKDQSFDLDAYEQQLKSVPSLY